MQTPGACQGKHLLYFLHETSDRVHLVPVDGIEAANKAHKRCKLPRKMPLYGPHSVLPILRWTLILLQVAMVPIYCVKNST